MGKRNGVLLTKKIVDGSHPVDKRYHVEPTGVKTFIAKYRANGGGRSATQRVAPSPPKSG
jgi:hypothetical protein